MRSMSHRIRVLLIGGALAVVVGAAPDAPLVWAAPASQASPAPAGTPPVRVCAVSASPNDTAVAEATRMLLRQPSPESVEVTAGAALEFTPEAVAAEFA